MIGMGVLPPTWNELDAETGRFEQWKAAMEEKADDEYGWEDEDE